MRYGLQWDAIYGTGVSNATDAQALVWDETNHNWEPGTVVGGSGYSTIEEDGIPLTQRTTINFVGASVTAADSGGKTVVTITSGPGGDSSILRTFALMGA